MTTCTLKGCAGLTGFIQTGLDSWSIYCPVCNTLTPADPPRIADDGDWAAARALSHLRSARYGEAEEGFLSAAESTADGERKAFYLWLSLLARYGVRYVEEVEFESIPAKRASLFLPTFGRFPLPDTAIQETGACRQLTALLQQHSAPETEKRLKELHTLLSEAAVCLKSRNTRSDVFIAWHDRPDDEHKRCSGLADRLNSMLNLSKECYSFVSFKDLTSTTVDHYEPHIYAALAAAKVLVVIIDDYDALGQKFLRSEIERFLGRKRQDDSLRLYFCGLRGSVGSVPGYIRETGLELHRDDAENTAHCAELIKTVVLNILREQRRAAAASKTPETAPRQPSVALEEAMTPVRLALSEKDWDTAKALLTALPVEQKTSAEYYLYGLLVNQQLPDVDALGDCHKPYEASEYWKQALQRANPRLKAHLKALQRTSIVGRLATMGITARRDGEGGIDLTDGKAYTGTQLSIPEGITRIAAQAFRGCKSLAQLSIPGSVDAIEHGAFCECPQLEKVQLSEGLRRMENGVFNSCPKLTALALPASLTDIQGNPLNGSSITELTIAANNPELYMEGGALLTRSGQLIALLNRALTEYTVPETVTAINQFAFYQCDKLERVTLPRELEVLGAGAFADCSRLRSILIPGNVTAIEAFTFSGCAGLEAVRLGPEVCSIGKYAFGNCTSLKQLQLPSVLEALGEAAFMGCTCLERIALPAGVQAIEKNTFKGCTSLTAALLPEQLDTIGENAFKNCEKLVELTLPDSLTAIGDSAFESCEKLTSVSIPGGVETIGKNAFKGCTALRELRLHDGLTAIGDNAFENCEKLTAARIPDTVEVIGSEAFRGCAAMEFLHLPRQLHSLGEAAFHSCAALHSVVVHDSLNAIEPYVFHGCTALKNVRLSEGLQSIGNYAFYECESLLGLSLPDTVETIGEHAFQKCKKLIGLRLPESLRTIGKWAFIWCESLKELNLPHGVTAIGDSAFYGCKALKSISAPSTLRQIDNDAFNVRGNLLFKYMNQTLPTVTVKKDSYAEKFFRDKHFPVNIE